MILPLLCACQLVAARGEFVVRAGAEASKVPLTITQGVSYLGQTTLRETLGAEIRVLPSGRAMLEIAGSRFELAHGVPFTRVNDKVIPLSAGPRFADDTVAIPFQLIAQVLPKVSAGVKYTPSTRTLVLSALPVANGSAALTDASIDANAERQASGSPTPPRSAPSPGRRKIIIDAGHGGPDEGTSTTSKSGTRITEKNITLSVSLLLGEELRKRNFEVNFTRTTDTLIALHDRWKIANSREGAAFISVHVNSAAGVANRKSIKGVETYFLSVAKTEDARRVQAIENGAARFERRDGKAAPDDPLSYILSDMQQNDHQRESSTLADRVQMSLSKAHPGGDRGVKQAEFAVLVGSFMPSVLVEIGFLSNASDAAFLAKKENQKKIAASIAQAVDGYFKGYDRRIVASGAGK